jgi:hypothetical protein
VALCQIKKRSPFLITPSSIISLPLVVHGTWYSHVPSVDTLTRPHLFPPSLPSALVGWTGQDDSPARPDCQAVLWAPNIFPLATVDPITGAETYTTAAIERWLGAVDAPGNDSVVAVRPSQ